jgi:hypothetical protein
MVAMNSVTRIQDFSLRLSRSRARARARAPRALSLFNFPSLSLALRHCPFKGTSSGDIPGFLNPISHTTHMLPAAVSWLPSAMTTAVGLRRRSRNMCAFMVFHLHQPHEHFPELLQPVRHRLIRLSLHRLLSRWCWQMLPPRTPPHSFFSLVVADAPPNHFTLTLV